MKEQLDKLATNQSPLPLILQTPNPSRLAYAIHQALKAIEHLQFAPYIHLLGAYRIRTGNGAVICEMRSDFVPTTIEPVVHPLEDYEELPDVLVEMKGTPVISFPYITDYDIDIINNVAEVFKRVVSSTNPLTLKLK